jgi:hypothetical protein
MNKATVMVEPVHGPRRMDNDNREPANEKFNLNQTLSMVCEQMGEALLIFFTTSPTPLFPFALFFF